jgi:hypothetical protein
VRGGPRAFAPRWPALAFCCLLLVVAASCGPRPGLVRLPAGQGVPAPDALDHYAAATRVCRSVDQLTAELALSGRVGGERVRGRLLVGLAGPDGVRLEAIAPFGAPVFVLTSRAGDATLVLPRDHRVVTGVTPEDLLDALAGLALSPADLLALVSGCLSSTDQASDPRAFGEAWRRVAVPGGEAWVRLEGGRPRLVAGSRGEYAVEYAEFLSNVPRRARVVARRGGQVTVDLSLELRQLDLAPDLDPRAFEATVPAGMVPMRLDQLRRGSLLGR